MAIHQYPQQGQQFNTTRWSIVFAAGREITTQTQAALSELCETYWPPLYAYLRRSGCTPCDAEDIVQGFFVRLLEKGDLAHVAPERGRFRSFLLAAVKHHLANQRNGARALKRGGGRKVISLNLDAAETRYISESSCGPTPDKSFDRQWAMTLIDTVQGQLRSECAVSGKEDRYVLLEPFLGGEPSQSYRCVAMALNMSENAVKVAVHRLRQRFRELLRSEIAQTVATASEIDDEIRDLFTVLRT